MLVRIPITIKQLPQLSVQLTQRTLTLLRPANPQPTFHLCFFSCHSYFKYLYCSVDSIKRYVTTVPYKIIVFSDTDQPLSEAQTKALCNLVPGTRVIPWPKSMGWGAEQISNIWQAYENVASTAAENDVIARVDSDVFFFNQRIFDAVSRSEADFIGDGHFVNFKYHQGGCYFFRKSAVDRVCNYLSSHSMENLATQLDFDVEDIAAYAFAKELDLTTWMTWFMMFPDELNNKGFIGNWSQWKFSCLHFVMKNKSAMLQSYEKEVFHGEPPTEYLSALALD
jgi:hypothetical protein